MRNKYKLKLNAKSTQIKTKIKIAPAYGCHSIPQCIVCFCSTTDQSRLGTKVEKHGGSQLFSKQLMLVRKTLSSRTIFSST